MLWRILQRQTACLSQAFHPRSSSLLPKSDKGSVIPETRAGHHYMSLMHIFALALSDPGQSKIGDTQYDKLCPKVSSEVEARTCPKYALYVPSAASLERHKKVVHQKAGAVNEVKEVSHVADEYLSCFDAVACEDSIGAVFMGSDPDKMSVYRNIFDAMQCPWTDELIFP
ncbi:hypothetical protein PoB_006743600 [Plakobranchus ocellatus]|uniref:Uncharacterized protein n=1 Tax=Plakobranchus ocellatus TaxID=259542 RepID=A0AAV4D9T9_9GAST|nr:hypothetical protein PoB_006743600 [Plakobranchus ocellatus]